MPQSLIGLFTGLLLALAGIFGGFDAFLFALVLGALGWVVGAQLEGKIDVIGALSSRGRG